jgi:hypothetical protein
MHQLHKMPEQILKRRFIIAPEAGNGSKAWF